MHQLGVNVRGYTAVHIHDFLDGTYSAKPVAHYANNEAIAKALCNAYGAREHYLTEQDRFEVFEGHWNPEGKGGIVTKLCAKGQMGADGNIVWSKA